MPPRVTGQSASPSPSPSGVNDSDIESEFRSAIVGIEAEASTAPEQHPVEEAGIDRQNLRLPTRNLAVALRWPRGGGTKRTTQQREEGTSSSSESDRASKRVRGTDDIGSASTAESATGPDAEHAQVLRDLGFTQENLQTFTAYNPNHNALAEFKNSAQVLLGRTDLPENQTPAPLPVDRQLTTPQLAVLALRKNGTQLLDVAKIMLTNPQSAGHQTLLVELLTNAVVAHACDQYQTPNFVPKLRETMMRMANFGHLLQGEPSPDGDQLPEERWLTLDQAIRVALLDSNHAYTAASHGLFNPDQKRSPEEMVALLERKEMSSILKDEKQYGDRVVLGAVDQILTHAATFSGEQPSYAHNDYEVITLPEEARLDLDQVAAIAYQEHGPIAVAAALQFLTNNADDLKNGKITLNELVSCLTNRTFSNTYFVDTTFIDALDDNDTPAHLNWMAECAPLLMGRSPPLSGIEAVPPNGHLMIDQITRILHASDNANGLMAAREILVDSPRGISPDLVTKLLTNRDIVNKYLHDDVRDYYSFRGTTPIVNFTKNNNPLDLYDIMAHAPSLLGDVPADEEGNRIEQERRPSISDMITLVDSGGENALLAAKAILANVGNDQPSLRQTVDLLTYKGVVQKFEFGLPWEFGQVPPQLLTFTARALSLTGVRPMHTGGSMLPPERSLKIDQVLDFVPEQSTGNDAQDLALKLDVAIRVLASSDFQTTTDVIVGKIKNYQPSLALQKAEELVDQASTTPNVALTIGQITALQERIKQIDVEHTVLNRSALPDEWQAATTLFKAAIETAFLPNRRFTNNSNKAFPDSTVLLDEAARYAESAERSPSPVDFGAAQRAMEQATAAHIAQMRTTLPSSRRRQEAVNHAFERLHSFRNQLQPNQVVVTENILSGSIFRPPHVTDEGLLDWALQQAGVSEEVRAQLLS